MLTRDYVRNRVGQRIPLTPEAAALLEQIRREDPDLGGVVPFGEVLAPEDVRRGNAPLETEDESQYQTSLISPLMMEVANSET